MGGGFFYEIDIVAHKRSPDFFMECKHGSRTLNLLFRSTRTCGVEVSFTDRIVGESLGVKILTFLVTRLTWSV